MLPIASLDGGQIGDAINPYFNVVGLTIGGSLIYLNVISHPLFYLVMLSGVYTTGMRLFGWDEKEKEGYYDIPKSKQLLILSSYLTLIGSLIIAMNENNKYRLTPKQIKAMNQNKENGDVWNIGIVKPEDFKSEHFNMNQHNEGGVYDDYFHELFKEENPHTTTSTMKVIENQEKKK